MITVEEPVIEVVVVCVFCDEPLDDSGDIWCPNCDGADAEVGDEEARPAR